MSSFDVVFHKDTVVDFDSGYSWYEEQKEGLGEKFLVAVRNRINQILANPDAFSVKSRNGYHETKVNGFPYSIVYRIYKSKEQILITSVHHYKRHPSSKYRR